MSIIFVRHGESEANLLGEFSNRGLKHPLTDVGRIQAAELASSFDPDREHVIFCSPLLRALETAQVIAAYLEVKVLVSDALREYDVGVFEGRSDQRSWEAFADLTEAWFARAEFDSRMEGGESLNDIRARFLPFIAGLGPESVAKDVICVGHGGTYRCMMPLLFDNVDFEFASSHGIGHTMKITGAWNGVSWTCLNWGDHKFQT